MSDQADARSPRDIHWQSSQLVREALEAARISYTTDYGQRDNVLIIVDGREIPVSTSRLTREGSLAVPARRWSKDADRHLVVDPDAGVVELHTRQEVVVVTLSADEGVELSRVAGTRWNVQRLEISA